MDEQGLARVDKITLFSDVVETIPGEQLKGDTILYTSLNGHMYSYLSKEGELALRLPEKERKEFLEKYDTELMKAYGIVQKEYVVVPDSLLSNTDELRQWFNCSYTYVGLMKPKPASKTKGKISAFCKILIALCILLSGIYLLITFIT